MFSEGYINTLLKKLGIKRKVKIFTTANPDRYHVKESPEEIHIYTPDIDYFSLAESLALCRISEDDPLITGLKFHPDFPESLKEKVLNIIHPIQTLWTAQLFRKCNINDIYTRIIKLSEFTLNTVVSQPNLKPILNNIEHFSVLAEHFLIIYDHLKNSSCDVLPQYLDKLLTDEDLKDLHIYLKYIDEKPSSGVYIKLLNSFGIPVSFIEHNNQIVLSMQSA
jgi:hypothetical protein